MRNPACIALVLFTALTGTSRTSSTEPPALPRALMAISRALTEAQRDLIAFRRAHGTSADYDYGVSLTSTAALAQLKINEVTDLLTIQNAMDCDRRKLSEYTAGLVGNHLLPGLRLDLEGADLDINALRDGAAKDAGIRVRTAIRQAIDLLGEEWH